MLALAVVSDVVWIGTALTICGDRIEGHAGEAHFSAEFCTLLVQFLLGQALYNPWNQLIHNLVDQKSRFLHQLVLILALQLSYLVDNACIVDERTSRTQFLQSQQESGRPSLIDSHGLGLIHVLGKDFHAILYVVVIGDLHAQVFHLWEKFIDNEMSGSIGIDIQRTHSLTEDESLVQQVIQCVLVRDEHLRDVLLLHLGNSSFQPILFKHVIASILGLHFINRLLQHPISATKSL